MVIISIIHFFLIKISIPSLLLHYHNYRTFLIKAQHFINILHNYYHYYYAVVKTICMLLQLEGISGPKAWPVLRLVKLELKGSVQ